MLPSHFIKQKMWPRKPILAEIGKSLYVLLLTVLLFIGYRMYKDHLRFATVIKAETPDERIMRNHLTREYNLKNTNVWEPPEHESRVSSISKPRTTQKEKLINSNEVSRVNKILIVSYMRSGSTFTSDLISQSKGVFLIFEPFWNICHGMKRNATYYTWDAICRNSEDEIKNMNKISDVLQNLFMCNFSHLPAEISKSFWFFAQGTGYDILNECYQSYKNRQVNASVAFDSATKGKCIKILKRFVKTHRLFSSKQYECHVINFLKLLLKFRNLRLSI